MKKRALWVALSVIALFVGLYLATVIGLCLHWPPEPRDIVMGRLEKANSYTDFWGHSVQIAELVEFGSLTYGKRVELRYHKTWPSISGMYWLRNGCSLTGFGAREGDTMELSTVEIGSCPPLPEPVLEPAPTTDAPRKPMTPEEFIELLEEGLRKPWWERGRDAWVEAAQKPVEWLHKRRDASLPKQILISSIPGVWFEAKYKFTGVTQGEQTQMAWRYSVLLENAEGAPPKPPPDSIAGYEWRYDELCLDFAYRLVDADGFTLERHRIYGIPTKAGQRQFWEATQWVNKDAAIRANRIVGTIELKWSNSCPHNWLD